MKIGIVTEYFYPTIGGITENVYNFAKELHKLGHDFRIVTSDAGDVGTINQDVKDRIRRVGRTMPVFFNTSCGRVSVGLGMAKKLSKLFEEEKFDILHVHAPQQPTLPILSLMYQKCPAVGTYHTCVNPRSIYKIYYHWTNSVQVRLAGAISVSSVCAEDNARCFVGPRHEIIPNGVDVNWWSKPAARPAIMSEKNKWIVFLGRPDQRNGLDVLIDAMPEITAKHPKARLLVVGDGPLLFYYKRKAKSLGGAAVFVGRATNERPAYLQHADAMCFLPDVASFGITVLEGMASKAPMVLTDLPAFRELVSNEKDALLVPKRRAEAVAAAVNRLLDEEDFSRGLANSAFAKVSAYDWPAVAKRTVDYYEKILFKCES